METYGQDLTAIIKEYCGDDVFETVTQNGEIMAVPANKNMGLAAALTYDRDMLADVGFKHEDITDLDSLEPIFEKLREKYPDVYPFVSTDVANKNLASCSAIPEKSLICLRPRNTARCANR